MADPDATFVGWRPGGPSLLQQLHGMVRGKVSRVMALGPFFDDKLRLLHEIDRLWGPQKIVAAVQPDTVSLYDAANAPQVLRFALIV